MGEQAKRARKHGFPTRPDAWMERILAENRRRMRMRGLDPDNLPWVWDGRILYDARTGKKLAEAPIRRTSFFNDWVHKVPQELNFPGGKVASRGR